MKNTIVSDPGISEVKDKFCKRNTEDLVSVKCESNEQGKRRGTSWNKIIIIAAPPK